MGLKNAMRVRITSFGAFGVTPLGMILKIRAVPSMPLAGIPD
jgi:hypothetical protein